MALYAFTACSGSKAKVWVSKSRGAYAYHKTVECQHIKGAVKNGNVEEITIDEAEKKDRTPCKTCCRM